MTAGAAAVVPFDRSYWVSYPHFLAGAYPGVPDEEGTRRRIAALVAAGVRTVVNLMEPDERDWQGRPFTRYDQMLVAEAARLGATARFVRIPIRDMGIPTHDTMRDILDTIDASIESGEPVYVHCWGGYGRTGTVVGCWLARHGVAVGDDALDRVTALRAYTSNAEHASPETEAQREMVRTWAYTADSGPLREWFSAAAEGVEFDDGLARQDGPGHTVEAAPLSVCHPGRLTSDYYAAAVAAGTLDPDEGERMLRALAPLQVTEPGHSKLGCFRWYREESAVRDTNAAFFTLVPLATVRLCCPDRVPAGHAPIIDALLRGSAPWFVAECREPSLYYPNKIVSDGALLLAIATILHDDELGAQAIAFFERWHDYTVRRGWGWGENISLGYQMVIFKALQLAVRALKTGKGAAPRERALCDALTGHMDELVAIARFHDGQEYVPTIRSYNFDGEVVRPSPVWELAGVTPRATATGPAKPALGDIVAHVLVDGKPLTNEPNRQPVPRVREERIFDACVSYSWVGEHARLGSLTEFPVMPGSYQWPTWGLGWQCFPVSYSVDEEQVGFLRWAVTERGKRRFHPTEDKATTYLDPALFGENWYPYVFTRCAQERSLLVAYRAMAGVHNLASSIRDEWVIPRFTGGVTEIDDATGRRWVALTHPNATLVFTALSGVRFDPAAATPDVAGAGPAGGLASRGPMSIDVVRDGETLRLEQRLYQGDEQTIHHPWLESVWCVIAVDGASGANSDALRELVDRVRIDDRSYADREVPRAGAAEIREIAVDDGRRQSVRLVLDPYTVAPR